MKHKEYSVYVCLLIVIHNLGIDMSECSLAFDIEIQPVQVLGEMKVVGFEID